jgi:hypothetical protein
VWGALTDRRWTVPLAATLALPVLWVSGFAICAAMASVPVRQPAKTATLAPTKEPEAQQSSAAGS